MTTAPDIQPVQQLAQLALALTTEADHSRLLERIMDGCLAISRSDAGTLYTLDEQTRDALHFTVLRNNSVIFEPVQLPPVALCDEQGERAKLVVVQTFIQQQTINIPDVYHCAQYDFSGTHRFDEQFNYRSKSFLCVPLKDHENQMIGVLQLINALDEGGNIIEFSPEVQLMVESLSSMAAAALTKRRLIDSQRALFEAFIKMIARAIDHKSPVTGKHCENVPEIARLLAQAVSTDQQQFAGTEFSAAQMHELKIAAWLHDCGKITTPEYVIDKSTKLETMVDRIKLISGRFALFKQHLHLQAVTGKLTSESYHLQCQQLDEGLAFLQRTNKGGEFMSDEALTRVDQLAEIEWTDCFGQQHRLLEADEVLNLKVRRGTLNDAERSIMQDHIVVTQEMLGSLPYPRHLAQVPEIAGNHHECMNGQGYPLGLTGEQMSIRARIMCIADIFEALTSPDRPYKKGMMLSQALTIIGRMVEEERLDRELFDLFVRSGACMEYARTRMDTHQIDEIDLDALPGLLGKATEFFCE
ncbi:MAG: HD domain-containing protein [Marinobacterium sp.]|nr:HD domain-containing protein [Marinobacterium sp.]